MPFEEGWLLLLLEVVVFITCSVCQSYKQDNVENNVPGIQSIV